MRVIHRSNTNSKLKSELVKECLKCRSVFVYSSDEIKGEECGCGDVSKYVKCPVCDMNNNVGWV